MTKFIQITFVIMTVFTLSSCQKYLDKKSSNTIVVASTPDHLQALLDDANLMNRARTPTLGEASADDYFLPATAYASRIELIRNIYKFTPVEYRYSNDWSFSYTPVYNSNVCLDAIARIPKTIQNAANWDNVYGSALFFRSYYFLQLAWIYAKAYDETSANTDLGIVLRLQPDFNMPSTRASVKETYERILHDAKEAAEYLPSIPAHTFRPSKAAAYGLLARTYLSMRVYDSAYKYSDLCLSIRNNLLDYNSFSLTGTSPFAQFAYKEETIFYTEMGIHSVAFELTTGARARIDTSLYASYHTDDLRKTAFFRDVSGTPVYRYFKGSYSNISDYYFSGIATDEMYLIRSECYARIGSGNKDAALVDLNNVMKKRWKTSSFIPFTATSAQDALTKILAERRKELLMRGIRWSDIKRLNKEGANIIPKRFIDGQTYDLQPNNNYYALPLPQDIIELTGITQNPR